MISFFCKKYPNENEREEGTNAMQCCRWGGIVCSSFFVSGACPELLPKGITTKKTHSF